MNIVEITGWKRGFNKVACTSTLCSLAGVNLVEGKRITDAVLEGQVQRIELKSEQEASRLVEFLTMHGAIARIA